VTQINYAAPGGALSYNPVGLTLEGFDETLKTYQMLPGGSLDPATLTWFDNTSLGRWLNHLSARELRWEGGHPDTMNAIACGLAPDANNDIHELSAQMRGEKTSPGDEGHPEGGNPVWIPNTQSTKNGGGATQETPWGELTMTPGKESVGEAQGKPAAATVIVDWLASASNCYQH
jgi:hypothetical protein